MKYLNGGGFVDLKYRAKLNVLINDMVKIHKPDGVLEYQALTNTIQTAVGYELALMSISVQGKMMKEEIKLIAKKKMRRKK